MTTINILKSLQLKKKKIFFGSKIVIFLSLGLRKGHPSSRRSLQPSKKEHSSILSFLFLWVIDSFLPFWIRTKPTKICADPSGPGSENGGKQW
jgi:hypothetical protein